MEKLNDPQKKSKAGIIIGFVIFIIFIIIVIAGVIAVYYFFIRDSSKKVNRLSVRQLYDSGGNISKQAITPMNSFYLQSNLDSEATIDGTSSTSNAMLSPDGNTVLILLSDGSLNLASKTTESDWKVVWKLKGSTSELVEPFTFNIFDSGPNRVIINLIGTTNTGSTLEFYQKIAISTNPPNDFIEVFNNHTFQIYRLNEGTKTVLFDTNTKN